MQIKPGNTALAAMYCVIATLGSIITAWPSSSNASTAELGPIPYGAVLPVAVKIPFSYVITREYLGLTNIYGTGELQTTLSVGTTAEQDIVIETAANSTTIDANWACDGHFCSVPVSSLGNAGGSEACKRLLSSIIGSHYVGTLDLTPISRSESVRLLMHNLPALMKTVDTRRIFLFTGGDKASLAEPNTHRAAIGKQTARMRIYDVAAKLGDVPGITYNTNYICIESAKP